MVIKVIVGVVILAMGLFGQTNVGSTISFTAPAPSAVDIRSISGQVVGRGGSQTYYYWVVVDYPGGSSIAAGPTKVINAPDTLSVSNYVQVSWNGVSGATGYDVLRTTSPTFPNGTFNMAVVTNTTNTTILDQTNSVTSYTLVSAPSANSTLYLDNISQTVPNLVFDRAIRGSSNDLNVIGALSATVSLSAPGAGFNTLNANNINNLIFTGSLISAINGLFDNGISVGQATNNPGVLSIRNPTINSAFTLKSSKTSGNLVGLVAPNTIPANSNNLPTATTAIPQVNNYNTIRCIGAPDGDGDFPCILGREGIPLPNSNTSSTSVTMNDANYKLMACYPIQAGTFTLTGGAGIGRSLKFEAGGTWSIAVADVPTVSYAITMFTDSACTAGAVNVTLFGTYPAATGALTTQAWTLSGSTYYTNTNTWRGNGLSSVVTNAAANPIVRATTFATGTFDPSTCSGGICGVGIRVAALAGSSATVQMTHLLSKMTIE